MGKKKNTRAKNCNSPGRLVSPFVGDINKGAEVVIPFNEKSQVADPPKHAYQTVYMSNENVTTGKSEPPKSNEENSSVSGIEATSKVPDRSSYQSLVDGGAYQSFRTSRRSLSRGNMSNASKYDHESAGDRVLAGSRSISRRSLLSDGSDYVKPLYTSSRAGSGIQWEDFENFEDDDDREKISREYPNVFNQTAKPSTSRVRTVSSNSELPHSSLCVDIPPNFSSSTSQRNVNQSGLDANVRTYLVDSEDFQNQGISKLSIQSSNDEFVLVGGHPPADSSTGDNISRRSRSMGNRTSEQVSVPRIYSRDSSIENFVKLDMPASDINPTQFSSKYDDLGRSISQQSLNSNTRTHEVFISRSSSRHTVETTNTDDRLILAARYSQSPEAEGLLPIPPPKTSSRRSSRSSNSSEKVSQEPFRFTSENNLAPGRSSSQRLERSTSSSSSVVPPESAMLVTSALTPVAPKNNLISLSRSDDSISIEAPQTVQRASNPKKTRTIGFPSNNVMSRMKTIEAAVQTGDSINIRQKQINVLSSDAYHPDSGEIEICTMKTECFVPPMVQKNERRSKSPEIVSLAWLIFSRVQFSA
uniref:Uncharacterized protein n=2 Tax=Caenorhabditis japonica TaxID=281687 RepID=A0A8R1ELZ7_CAEJA